MQLYNAHLQKKGNMHIHGIFFIRLKRDYVKFKLFAHRNKTLFCGHGDSTAHRLDGPQAATQFKEYKTGNETTTLFFFAG